MELEEETQPSELAIAGYTIGGEHLPPLLHRSRFCDHTECAFSFSFFLFLFFFFFSGFFLAVHVV